MDKWLGGPQRRSGHGSEEKKKSLSPPTCIINNAELRMEGRNMIGNMVSEMLQRAVCLQNNRKHFIISDMTNAVAMRCW